MGPIVFVTRGQPPHEINYKIKQNSLKKPSTFFGELQLEPSRKKGDLGDIKKLVKFGLCPEKDIDSFEKKSHPIIFVDLLFNPNQIEKKLEKKIFFKKILEIESIFSLTRK